MNIAIIPARGGSKRILKKNIKIFFGNPIIYYPLKVVLKSRLFNNIFVTTSSACSDNEPETSKVLKAMGINDKVGRGVVRISFCTNTKEESYLTVEKALLNAYNKLEKIHSY